MKFTPTFEVKMRVVDREKYIAYLDGYGYVIHIPAKKHYQLRLHTGICSVLIGWGLAEIIFRQVLTFFPDWVTIEL